VLRLGFFLNRAVRIELLMFSSNHYIDCLLCNFCNGWFCFFFKNKKRII